jgi:hypothetical protein
MSDAVISPAVIEGNGDLEPNGKVNTQYVAGLIDGEGTVTYLPRKSVKGNISYALIVDVSNTNRTVLEALKAKYGGSISVTKRAPPCKTCYTWRVQSRLALRVLEEVFPYLIVKKKQAEILIPHCRAKRRNAGGKRRPREFWEKERAIRQTIRSLNKRGV